MIEAVIVDDESYIRDDVREKIQEYFPNDIKVINEAGSVKEGIAVIEGVKPSLLFLDIDLSDGNAFDLIEKLAFKNYKVIFITGFDSHAIKAIKVGALDYILKPIDDLEFQNAVKKAIRHLESDEIPVDNTSVTIDYFNKVNQKQIVLDTIESKFIVALDDILYCKSDGNYTEFFLNNNPSILISKPMKKISEIIPEQLFVRCHQSYLVNKTYIKRYDKNGFFVLQNDVNVPVATRRKDFALKAVFG